MCTLNLNIRFLTIHRLQHALDLRKFPVDVVECPFEDPFKDPEDESEVEDAVYDANEDGYEYDVEFGLK